MCQVLDCNGLRFIRFGITKSYAIDHLPFSSWENWKEVLRKPAKIDDENRKHPHPAEKTRLHLNRTIFSSH